MESDLPPPGVDPGQWAAITARARTLDAGPAQTIRPRARALGSTGRDLHDGADGGPVPRGVATPSLELGEVLGEGGMGVVRLATQTAMARPVAVKAVRPARRSPQRTLKLLQEAWTAGRLEHPNIVPVYDIATDEDGEPLIVLKLIEGESWSSLLAGDTDLEERFGVSDPLEWHLQVLIQICNAIHFAHDRGILHLDLKPENVMLGNHGEIYVVDWGIAMALEDDGSGRIPVAAACSEVVGTPHYMAPEMLAGSGERLSPATDVFLLGAMLHELLAGEPPHRGDTIIEVMHAALSKTPALPEDGPAELLSICRTAMATDPSERYPSAEALRRALQSYLDHRGSERLADQALERLAVLERTLAAHEPVGPSGRELFGQVCFGFEQALDSWPDNEPAKEGLARAVEGMIEHELAHGDPKVAAALAREHTTLSDQLAARVDAAVAADRANRDALEQLGREYDPETGLRTRRFVIGLLAALWAVAPLLMHFEVIVLAPTYLQTSIPALLSLVLLGWLRWWARDSIGRTRINRVAVLTAILSMASEPLMMLGAMLLDIPALQALVLNSLIWALLLGLVAFAFDLRMLWVAGAYLVCFLVSAARMEWMFLALSATNVVFVIVVVRIWRPGPRTETPATRT